MNMSDKLNLTIGLSLLGCLSRVPRNRETGKLAGVGTEEIKIMKRNEGTKF